MNTQKKIVRTPHLHIHAYGAAIANLGGEGERIYDAAIRLLCAWSTGNAEDADPAMQELAIRTAARMREHVSAGTSPLEDAEPLDGSMATAGGAMGQTPTPIVPVWPDERTAQ